jgi:hypothetical protein
VTTRAATGLTKKQLVSGFPPPSSFAVQDGLYDMLVVNCAIASIRNASPPDGDERATVLASVKTKPYGRPQVQPVVTAALRGGWRFGRSRRKDVSSRT